MTSTPDFGHYVRCPARPAIVERSSLFEHHVQLLASGVSPDMSTWVTDLAAIAETWGLAPGRASRDKVASHIRDAAATLADVRAVSA